MPKCLKNGERHKKVMWRHTKVKVSKIEGAPMVPLCLKFGAISTYLQSYGILKKMAHVIFLWSAAILKVSVEPYRFSNIP